MKRTRKLSAAGLTIGLVVALLSGCAGTTAVTQQTAKPEVSQQNAAKPAVESDPGTLSGKVVETMNVGNYTYINLEKDGKKSWAATPVTTVTVGQEIKLRPGTPMGQFTSKVLNKTFDEIVFSPGLVKDTTAPLPTAPSDSETKGSLPAGHPPMDAKPLTDQGKSSQDTKEQQAGQMGKMKQPGIVTGKVVETMDSGGYTYICLENGGKKTWAAVPSMKVSVGQEIDLLPGQTMYNFNSKSLNRTFESVIFSGGVLPATK